MSPTPATFNSIKPYVSSYVPPNPHTVLEAFINSGLTRFA